MTAQELRDFLINNPSDTKLPEDPVIRGDLELQWKPITWLPDNLVVTGNMSIEGCRQLPYLPSNLYVGGNLNISLSKITMIPPDMNVCGDINAEELILDIPDGFTVNRNLYLNSTFTPPSPLRPLLRLPRSLTVNGDLDIRNRVIEKWPKNLVVRGRLICNSEDEIRGVIISGTNR